MNDSRSDVRGSADASDLALPASWHTLLKGTRLGRPAEIVASTCWRALTVSRYGGHDRVDVALYPVRRVRQRRRAHRAGPRAR